MAPTSSTQASPPRRADVTSADGTRIAVHASGEGRPLVLIHGAAGDHTRWRPVLPALAERVPRVPVGREPALDAGRIEEDGEPGPRRVPQFRVHLE